MLRVALLISAAVVLLFPAVGGAADPVVAAAGDIASSSAGDTATANVLDALNPSLVLTLGDNAYESGTSTQFATYYDPTWGRHKPKTRPSLGNHDYQTSGASGYFGYFGSLAGPASRGYYSFDLGSWHLVSLNSEIARDAGSSQLAWLRSDLAATTQPCILAYWHKPRFSSGPHGSDGSFAPFWDALAAVGADVVLSAHDHLYERFAPQTSSGAADPNGIRQFVVGTGGRSHYQAGTARANSLVRNSDTFGVLALTLHASSYDWRFAPEAGRSFTDTGSASCHGASDTAAPSTPTNLRASASGPTTVNLTWNASTDNVGVAGYDVYRNGALLTKTGPSTAYSDASAAASTSYSYQVRARDGAGNTSGSSNTATVTTPAASSTSTPISFVRQTVAAMSAAGRTLTVPVTSSAQNTLVAAIAVQAGGSVSVTSVADSSGATWTKAAAGFLTGANTRIELWYRAGAPALTSVTVRLSTADVASANISEWQNVATVNPLDAGAAAGNASSTSASTPAITTTSSGDLVLGAVNYQGAAVASLSASGFTALANFDASTMHGRIAYRLAPPGGPHRVSWTLSAATASGGAIVALRQR
jgi:calcineurin-like phosphoesterase family protein/fibronectin type III domain protein